MIKKLLLVIFILLSTLNCQVAGKNPEEAAIPVIEPTIAKSYCMNDEYPVDAPKFDAVSKSQFSKVKSQLQDNNEDSLYLNQYDIVIGEGPSPTLNDLVTVHYSGWLEDGCLFDASYLRGVPSNFLLIQVIKGWTETLQSMKEGGRRRVEIPSELAYGINGRPPVIPGNATLTFDIKLVSVLTPENASATATATVKE